VAHLDEMVVELHLTAEVEFLKALEFQVVVLTQAGQLIVEVVVSKVEKL